MVPILLINGCQESNAIDMGAGQTKPKKGCSLEQ
jgi:hypothetical protein